MKKLALFATMIPFLGCAASINPHSTVTYDETGSTTIDSVAILPVTAGEGLEGFRRQTADSVRTALQQAHPNLTVLDDGTSLERLNKAGLAQQYADMVEDYRTTGVLDGETLKNMGDAIGAPYLLAVRVSYAEKSETGYNALTGISTTEHQNVGLFAHLWSPEAGDVVWEADAGAEVSAGDFERTRELNEIIAEACTALANRFPQ